MGGGMPGFPFPGMGPAMHPGMMGMGMMRMSMPMPMPMPMVGPGFGIGMGAMGMGGPGFGGIMDMGMMRPPQRPNYENNQMRLTIEVRNIISNVGFRLYFL